MPLLYRVPKQYVCSWSVCVLHDRCMFSSPLNTHRVHGMLFLELPLHICSVHCRLSCSCNGWVLNRTAVPEEASSRLVANHLGPCSIQSHLDLVIADQSNSVALIQLWPWRLARFLCSFRAACVGGTFSSDLDFLVNNSFLALLISKTSLVLSYMRITNLSICDCAFSVRFPCILVSSSKASVTSGYTFHVSQAVFSPLPPNADTVSHPVKAWKMGRTVDFRGSIVWEISWTAIYLKLGPFP